MEIASIAGAGKRKQEQVAELQEQANLQRQRTCMLVLPWTQRTRAQPYYAYSSLQCWIQQRPPEPTPDMMQVQQPIHPAEPVSDVMQVQPAEQQPKEYDDWSRADDIASVCLVQMHHYHVCWNCKTLQTKQWRKGWIEASLRSAVDLCNACGLKWGKRQYCSRCNVIYNKLYMNRDLRPDVWAMCTRCRLYRHRTCFGLAPNADVSAFVCCAPE